MIFEGVNFNESLVRKMTKEEFEKMHLNLFWLDRDKETRKKMIDKVYSIIVNPKKKAGK